MHVRKMLKINDQVDESGVESFSRSMPSFYPLLCIEIYGKYENSGEYFNKAMNLYRKITGNDLLLEEIKSLDMSKTDSEYEDEERGRVDKEKVPFRLVELVKLTKSDEKKNDKEVT